ncbi:MAG: ABC transporter permease, partial [Draconibacterium sp.]|nr:ABC transporter permease [Draconibacterium sp.]
MGIDTSFVSTYGLKLLAGRNLSLTDSSKTILINEELARQFNFKTPEEAVGKVVMLYHDPNSRVTISGVLKDYHYDTFYSKIRPTLLIQNSNQVRLAGIKLAMSTQNRSGYLKQLKNVLAFTENNWKQIYKNEIYEYEFLDDAINKYYINEGNSSKLISVFAFITVFIACIGIFGPLYLSEQRSKEIGIRKINGAKISEILTMLNKDFVKWVAIAFVIATPVAYYAMHKWLENFAYKTSLSW